LAFLSRGNRPLRKLLATTGYGVLMLGGYLGGHLACGQQIGVSHAVAEGLPTELTPVLREAELMENEPRRVELGASKVVLVKQGGRVHALFETCSHLGGPLAEGSVEGNCIRCPWHGSLFSLEDGSVIEGPATAAQPCFDVRVRDGTIEVCSRAAEAP
jgi:nitrite reductase/ring-hydroxylating ferredoxin subunit